MSGHVGVNMRKRREQRSLGVPNRHYYKDAVPPGLWATRKQDAPRNKGIGPGSVPSIESPRFMR